MAAKIVLECTDVSKHYLRAGRSFAVLDRVSVRVEQGEFVAICGPSGSGKSTLLNIIGLVDRPTEGSVLLDGDRIRSNDEGQLVHHRRRTLGYVFQRFNLLPTFTVEENVAFPLTLLGQSLKTALITAREVLTELGLEAISGQMPLSLSGGEMQRVAIARAAIHRPKIILADEPTGSLDSKNGQIVLELLTGLTARGCSVLMATHSEAATRCASRAIHLSDGSIVPESHTIW